MGFVKDLWDGITGKSAADASLQGANVQSAAIDRAMEEMRISREQFEPFRQLGLGAIPQAGFLTDPNQQMDFLRSNPLFGLALENANNETMKMAAARGRLSAGDTLQQLSNNVLLSASPLINDQKNSILSMLNIGTGAQAQQQGATSGIADLITGQGATQAAGIVGAGNARGQGASNLLTTGLLAGAAFGFPGAAASPGSFANFGPTGLPAIPIG